MSQNSERLFANQAFLDLVGVSSLDELRRQPQIADFVAPYDRQRINEARLAREAGETLPSSYEYDLIHRDGRTVSVQVFTRPIIWEGTPAHQRTYVDLTARKQAEKSLRESEKLYHDVTEASPDAMVIIDVRGRIVFLNSSALNVFGAEAAAQLLGRDMVELIHPDRRAEILQYRTEARCEIVPHKIELTRLKLDGTEFPSAGSVAEINWRGEPARLLIIQDLTEQVQMEERLRQAQRMEATGQLTGGIAHDFNNLLMIIQGNAELLATGRSTDREEMANAILAATRRGSELTHRLLAFSRRQPLRPTTISLTSVALGLREMLARTLGETIEIDFVTNGDTWPALADEAQVAAALLNLAINARDAMPNGGRLTIECGNARLEEGDFAASPEVKAGEYAVLSVRDTGTGMTDHVLARAFEPFFTTKETGKGSGLGLSMVYGFARQSNGHLSISSEIGEGTTVMLYLPRSRTPSAAAPSDVGQNIPLGNGERILVIEDDPGILTLATRMLGSLGYAPHGVENAAEALRTLKDGAPVDLVLSDIILKGGITGPEFAQAAKRSRPNLRIMYMSGCAAESASRGGLLEPGMILIGKPFQRAELARAIRKILSGTMTDTGGPAASETANSEAFRIL